MAVAAVVLAAGPMLRGAHQALRSAWLDARAHALVSVFGVGRGRRQHQNCCQLTIFCHNLDVRDRNQSIEFFPFNWIKNNDSHIVVWIK